MNVALIARIKTKAKSCQYDSQSQLCEQVRHEPLTQQGNICGPEKGRLYN
jgi:hypothetical protein